MKKFALFAGQEYYPGGGFKDFQSDHDTLRKAQNAANKLKGKFHENKKWGWCWACEWYQIIDTETLSVVEEWNIPYP